MKSGVASLPLEQLQKLGLDERMARWTVSSSMPGTQATELRSIPSKALKVANQIANFTQTVFGLQLMELVVDCLQDEHGIYHFSQVKAFTAQPQWLRRMRSLAASEPTEDDWKRELREDGAAGPAVKKGSSSKKVIVPTAVCSTCTCDQPLKNMSKRMTVKMMMET